ncbi:HEAT repeat domain-containing protein [Streptomyces atratus]|uniref:HEAT repeat domain-containing protein n=1 Tax=Streptomyces atratus TaxID=1893 RepID=UPI0038D1B0CC
MRSWNRGPLPSGQCWTCSATSSRPSSGRSRRTCCAIGEPALQPLAHASAAANSPEIARRAGWALGRLKVEDPGAYEPLLNHEHPRVRSDALFAFQVCGEAAERFVDRLIPLLGDPEPEVRQRAVWAFQAIGTAAVPDLQRVRRLPAPGTRVRAGALEALAAIAVPRRPRLQGPGRLAPTDEDQTAGRGPGRHAPVLTTHLRWPTRLDKSARIATRSPGTMRRTGGSDSSHRLLPAMIQWHLVIIERFSWPPTQRCRGIRHGCHV